MWNSFNSYEYGMHSFGPMFWFAPFFLILLPLVVALKGYTLWHAAKRNELWWFVALLVVNTMGLLELAYIIFVLKKFSSHTHVSHPHTKEEHTHNE